MRDIVLLSLIGRGGTFHTVINISGSFTKHYNTHILLPTYSDTSKISSNVNLIKTYAPPNTIKTLLSTLNIFQHLKNIRTINKCNPEIINIMDIHPWYILYWPFIKGRKIITINDPELHSGDGSWIISKITKFLLSHADTIIVLCKKQEEVIRRLGYTQNVIVSRIGHYSTLTSNNLTFDAYPKNILFFGRIKEYKGLSYLLDAIKGLDCKLIIAGDGDLTPYREQLVGLNVEIHNEFLPDDKVGQYFDKAAFTVLPYIDATQTGIIPVAYAARKAVIVTNVGSLPEFVEEGITGLIVPSKDVKALREAIIKLLDDPIKTQIMGLKGYSYMLRELDWDIIVDKLVIDINKTKKQN
jgi:glycosyltransferase involved in cell wall biosynthesis